MSDKKVTYDDLNVGAKFIHNYEVHEKLEPMPPMIPVASKVLREATMKDAEMYHVIEEL